MSIHVFLAYREEQIMDVNKQDISKVLFLFDQ